MAAATTTPAPTPQPGQWRRQAPVPAGVRVSGRGFAGHSKWANIKHRKGAQDKVRACAPSRGRTRRSA